MAERGLSPAMVKALRLLSEDGARLIMVDHVRMWQGTSYIVTWGDARNHVKIHSATFWGLRDRKLVDLTDHRDATGHQGRYVISAAGRAALAGGDRGKR